jgi:plastocyanin
MPPARIIVGVTAPLALLVLLTGTTVAAAASLPAPEQAGAGPAPAVGVSPSIPCPPAAAPSFDALPAPADSAAETAPPGAAQPTPCSSAPPPSMQADHVELTVEAGDLWFGPDALTITSQGTTTITLIDVGAAVHNLSVDELGLLVVAAPGQSSQVSIVDPKPGTYEFYCSVSGHRAAGMIGTLIVE